MKAGVIMYDKSKVKENILSLIDYSKASAVLDIGCGRGEDLIEIAGRIGERALLYGVDTIPKSIDLAKTRTDGDARFCFELLDVEDGLKFNDNTFDVVYSCNVLECIKDKNKLLNEVARVLKPGGQIVFAHFDWDTQVFNAKDKVLYRKILHTFNDWKQPWMAECDPWMGRKLHGIFESLCLFLGEVSVYVLVETEYREGFKGYNAVNDEFEALVQKRMIEESDYTAFYNEITQLAVKGEYFYSINIYIYHGHKI